MTAANHPNAGGTGIPSRSYTLVAIEGPDGAGKSSLARRLAAGPAATLTRLAPAMGAAFRTLVDERSGGERRYQDVVPPSLRHATYLVEAAVQFRYQADWFERFELVVADRWLQTWDVYCGEVAEHADWYRRMAEYVPTPDLLIYLRVSPETALERLAGRGDWTAVHWGRERLLADLTRLREAYDVLMARHGCVTIDADGSADEVAERAEAAVAEAMLARIGLARTGPAGAGLTTAELAGRVDPRRL